jgi:hypothetical protein
VASAAPGEQSGGWFSGLARKMGIGGHADAVAAAAPPPPPAPTPAKPKIVEARRNDAGPRVEKLSPTPKAAEKPETRQAAAHPPLKPSATDSAAAAPPATPKDAVLAGAQPIVSSNSFESRFSAVK